MVASLPCRTASPLPPFGLALAPAVVALFVQHGATNPPDPALYSSYGVFTKGEPHRAPARAQGTGGFLQKTLPLPSQKGPLSRVGSRMQAHLPFASSHVLAAPKASAASNSASRIGP